MQLPDLQHSMQWLTALVWIYQIAWATRIFARTNEQPSMGMVLFPLTWALLFFRTFSSRLEQRLWIPGALCMVGSIVLFEWARHTIQGKYFSYAFSKDTPQFLLTSGPYTYIRNPFYSSYMISYIGAVLLFPGIAIAAGAAGLIAIFAIAALKEERKFARSPIAAAYEIYRQRTGRFMPKLWK